MVQEMFTKLGRNGEVSYIEREFEPFDYEGYEVVRRKSCSKKNQPAVTLKHGSFVFNAYAIKMLDECSNIQILLNLKKKAMIARSCDKYLFDSVQWSRIDKRGKVIPKIVYGKPFTGLLFYEMYWDFKGTVKILGTFHNIRGEKFLEFKLDNKA